MQESACQAQGAPDKRGEVWASLWRSVQRKTYLCKTPRAPAGDCCPLHPNDGGGSPAKAIFRETGVPDERSGVKAFKEQAAIVTAETHRV